MKTFLITRKLDKVVQVVREVSRKENEKGNWKKGNKPNLGRKFEVTMQLMVENLMQI